MEEGFYFYEYQKEGLGHYGLEKGYNKINRPLQIKGRQKIYHFVKGAAMYDIFISYRTTHIEWVEILARNLAKQGYKVFLDIWELLPGQAIGCADARKRIAQLYAQYW